MPHISSRPEDTKPTPLRPSSIRARLFVALAAPIVVLVSVGLLLARQVAEVTQNGEQLEHSRAVLTRVQDALGLVLDQETALRGYLLTGSHLFLEAYEEAHPGVALRQLEQLTAPDSVQRGRANELRQLYHGWREKASAAFDQNLQQARSTEELLERTEKMDALKGAATAFLDEEQSKAAARAQELRDTSRNTRLLLLSLLGSAALALAFVSRRNLQGVSQAYGSALDGERRAREALEAENWLRSSHMKVAEVMRGELSIEELCSRCLEALVPQVGAELAALFVLEADGFRRRASLGLPGRVGHELFAPGQGLVGRAAQSEAMLEVEEVPADFFHVRAGTGESTARRLALIPAAVDGVSHAVVELGFFQPISPRARALLERVGEPIAMAVRSAQHRTRLRELLSKSQQQAEELQAQQEELRVANEELQEHSNALAEARTQLERRQKELSDTNTNLERQAAALREAQAQLLERAEELSRTSQYKSDFLANMSHELRTPLNSSLILAKLLADNRSENLTDEQVKYAETIHSACNDLLTLINDILDLSKIEAGHMEVHRVPTTVPRILEPVARMFEPVAREKGLAFQVEHAPDLPRTIETDLARAQQILKNLLSNALKFTDRGSVSLRVSRHNGSIAFAVRDTGIGIPKEQQERVFEAFRQVNAASTRRHGGTGLGLAISRDLAELLGGALILESQPGAGSTFTLSLPISANGPRAKAPRRAKAGARPLPSPPPAEDGTEDARSAQTQARGVHPGTGPLPSALSVGERTAGARPNGRGIEGGRPLSQQPTPVLRDDRDHLDAERRLLLVVEDDERFAEILLNLARELEFQCVVAQTADEALQLVETYVPSAVLLDINLPDHSGLSVLDRLKRSPATRHVPVHVISATDLAQEALSMGALGYAIKPVTREGLLEAFRKLEKQLKARVKRVLVVEDDPAARDSICRLLAAPDVETVAVGSASEALKALRHGTFDCMVTDLSLPDQSGYELLEKMTEDEHLAFPPVIVYTGRSLSSEEEQRLRLYSSSIIVKGARSPERLLDEVTLFLHQVESALPPEHQRMLRKARDREAAFEGRTILLVEDDVRNIFALSSVLEAKGASLRIARNGIEALRELEARPEVDLVLMDLMMPEMDGLTAIREIRKRPRLSKLPIIALTAKAMSDDRQSCLDAGANDYIAKPIEVEKLLSLLRVWMPR